MRLLLHLTSNENKQVRILLADNVISSVGMLTRQFGEVTCVPVEKSREEGAVDSPWIIYESIVGMKGYTLNDIYIYCYTVKQEQEEAKFEDSSPYSASLGHISIRNSAENIKFPPADSWIIELQDVSWGVQESGAKTASLTITWKLKEENARSFPKYNIYIEKLGNQAKTDPDPAVSDGKKFLGFARVERFYVSNLRLEAPEGIIRVKFIVQPSRDDGVCQELDNCPALEFGQ